MALNRTLFILLALYSLHAALFLSCASSESFKLRVGHFPNITHAQALVARQLARRGEDWFQPRLNQQNDQSYKDLKHQQIEVEWYLYNAGPSAMEAILAQVLDISFVGPNPAINAHIRSAGKEIRAIAGTAFGGSGLILRAGFNPAKIDEFKGRRVATPQIGNTQDIAARVYFQTNGLKVTQMGGDLFIVPTPNPEQLRLLKSGQIDAAWTVEPWLSRLEQESAGKIYFEEKAALTTLLVASRSILENRRSLIRSFVTANHELTLWIKNHPERSKELIISELKELTGQLLSSELYDRAFSRLRLDTSLDLNALKSAGKDAHAAGFLKTEPDLSLLLDRP